MKQPGLAEKSGLGSSNHDAQTSESSLHKGFPNQENNSHEPQSRLSHVNQIGQVGLILSRRLKSDLRLEVTGNLASRNISRNSTIATLH